MERFNILLLVLLTIIMIMIAFLLVKSGDCSGAPRCPTGKYTDSPVGQCLLACDKTLDACYEACRGDEDCVRGCYQVKAACYIDCLGSKTEICETGGDCQCGN